MNTPFFITGLPRTRTAWLANLFCTESTVCFHEPTAKVLELVSGFPWLRVGVSDATLTLRWPAIKEAWPNARWLYVERDPADAMRSFLRFTRDHVKLLHRHVQTFWAMHAAAAARMRKEAGEELLVVKFDELQDPVVITRAWEHLLPASIPINPVRLQVLEKLKIEQDVSRRIFELPQMQARIEADLPELKGK